MCTPQLLALQPRAARLLAGRGVSSTAREILRSRVFFISHHPEDPLQFTVSETSKSPTHSPRFPRSESANGIRMQTPSHREVRTHRCITGSNRWFPPIANSISFPPRKAHRMRLYWGGSEVLHRRGEGGRGTEEQRRDWEWRIGTARCVVVSLLSGRSKGARSCLSAIRGVPGSPELGITQFGLLLVRRLYSLLSKMMTGSVAGGHARCASLGVVFPHSPCLVLIRHFSCSLLRSAAQLCRLLFVLIVHFAGVNVHRYRNCNTNLCALSLSGSLSPSLPTRLTPYLTIQSSLP